MLRRLTEPALPISGQEILSHLRESSPMERALVETWIRESIDQIETVCERAIGFAKYSLTFNGTPSGVDNTIGPVPYTQHRYPVDLNGQFLNNQEFNALWPPAIELPMPPVQQIVAFQYYDTDEASQTWAAENYLLYKEEPGKLFAAPDKDYPDTSNRRDAVTITFWAGETDQLTFTAGADPAFTSTSGYPWADDESFVLRASGNLNCHLGKEATVPTGFSNMTTYYVVDSDDAGSFNLAATSGGAKITGGTPEVSSGTEIDLLFAHRMRGTTAAGLRKMVTDAYQDRCDAGQTPYSNDRDAFFYQPHLRKMLWRPAMQL